MELLKKLGMVFATLWLVFQIIGLVIGLSIVGIVIFEIIKFALLK